MKLPMTMGAISSLLISCASQEKAIENVTSLGGLLDNEKTCHTPQYLNIQNQGIDLPVTIWDYNSNYADVENFNSKKLNPGMEDCGSLEQPQLQNAELKESFLKSLRERYPEQFPWATQNSREIYPTFGMVADTLDVRGLPVKARTACNNDNLNDWYVDQKGVNLKVKDQLSLKPIDEMTYQVEFLHFKGNSYLPLDKFAADSTVKTFGKQNLPEWCLDDMQTCQAKSDQAGLQPNSVPEGSNFGFTMTTEFDFIFNSRFDEYFDFDGDDDYWVFIDGQLVVDAGGTHVLVKNQINLKSLASSRGWLDGSSHHLQLFFAERQADASNLKVTLKTSGVQDISQLDPYIYKAYQLNAGEEDPKYLLYFNTPIESQTLSQLNQSKDINLLSVYDDLNNDLSEDFKIKSIKPYTDSTVTSQIQGAYVVEFENSAETQFVAPLLGQMFSLNTDAAQKVKFANGKELLAEVKTSILSSEKIETELKSLIPNNHCSGQ